MLLCKTFIMAKDSPHIIMQRVTFECILGVCSCWCQGQCVVTQPKPWYSCWCQSVCRDMAQALVFLLVSVCCDTAQALVFLLVSVSVS